jgi:hypothetical protein
MTSKSFEDRPHEACAEEGAYQPPCNHHHTRHADFQAAKETTRPRNFVAIARTAQDLKDALRGSQEWKWMPADQREALDVIACGMALVINGQANKPQTWDEIAEQAAAMAERVGRK